MIYTIRIRLNTSFVISYFQFFLFFSFYCGSLTSQSHRIVYSEADRQAILLAHNQERRLVGNQDLTWDYDLEEFAADWASTLASRGSGLSHRPNNKYGENCYWSSTSYVNPDAAILSFNEEKKIYRYGPVSYQNYGVTGHYTQVVWYRTTKVGCAAVSGNSGTFVVCNYNPPGNFIGDYPYNNANVKSTPSRINSHAVIEIEPESDPISIPIPTKPSTTMTQVQTPVRIQAHEPIRNSIPTAKPQPMGNPAPNEPIKSKNNTSQVSQKATLKSAELKKTPYVFMFSGIETWTEYYDLPLITQKKLKQDINFTGASPIFQLSATLPKPPDNKIKNIRGVFSVGCTLSNRILQNQFGQSIGNDQSGPRLYSPLYYDFGLQCWKYFQVNVGQTLFGLMATSNTLDGAVLNRCSIRVIIPMGRNFTISVHASGMGQQFDIPNWSMASVGVSLRSKFY
jgi:pathogenesis-related protein 1